MAIFLSDMRYVICYEIYEITYLGIRYVTEWKIVVGLNKKMGSVLVLCVNRPLNRSPFKCGAWAEISSHSSTKSTIIFSRSTSQKLRGWVSEVIHHCSVLYVSFYLGFLARSPKRVNFTLWCCSAAKGGVATVSSANQTKGLIGWESHHWNSRLHRGALCDECKHMGVPMVPPLFLLT